MLSCLPKHIIHQEDKVCDNAIEMTVADVLQAIRFSL